MGAAPSGATDPYQTAVAAIRAADTAYAAMCAAAATRPGAVSAAALAALATAYVAARAAADRRVEALP